MEANKLDNIIPIWRKIIHETTNISLNNIISVNSYYKSDLSLITNDGEVIDGNVKNIVLFDLNSIDHMYTDDNIQENKISTSYKCQFIIDIYGDDSNEQALKFITQLKSYYYLSIFHKNNIGLDVNNIKFTNQNEQIHEKTWARSHIELEFVYEYVDSIILQTITEGNIEIS